MKILLGSLLISFATHVHGQLSDQQKIQYLNERARYNLASDRDSVCFYANQAFELNDGRFPTEEAKNFAMLGMCQKYEGKLDSAYVLFDLAKDFFLENEMTNDLGTAYWYLGKVWFDLQQFDRATPLYLEAIRTYEESGNFESQFKVINGLAVMEFFQGNYVDGLEYLKKALEIVEREKFYDNHFRLYNNIGLAYAHLNEHDKALEFNQKAISLTDTSSNKGLMVQALSNRAELYEGLDEPDSAVFYYNLALEVAENFGHNTSLLMAGKSDLFYSRNELDKAIASLRNAVEESSDPAITDRYLLQLGILYSEINDIDSSEFFLKKAWNLSVQNNLRRTAYKAAKLLSEIYFEKNDYRQAYKYLSNYSAYKDSVFNSDTERKISDFRVQVETLDKTNEIDLLKARAEVDALSRISIIRQSIGVVLILILIIVLILLWNRNKQKKQKISYLKLQGEMEMNDLELQKQTLYMINVNNQMKEVEDSLRTMNSKNDITNNDIRKIISGIMVNRSMDKEWDKFENYFSKAHKEFMKHLQLKHGNLTQQDRRLTTLIKMDLSNREIASILDIEQRSVIIKRYRLKKKLNLEKDGDLEGYIQTL